MDKRIKRISKYPDLINDFYIKETDYQGDYNAVACWFYNKLLKSTFDVIELLSKDLLTIKVELAKVRFFGNKQLPVINDSQFSVFLRDIYLIHIHHKHK